MKGAPTSARFALAALLFVGGEPSLAIDISEYPGAGSSGLVSVSSVDELHKGAVAYLRTVIGNRRSDQVLDSIKNLGDSLRIVSACGSSVKKAGSTDIALALADSKLKTIKYVIAYEGVDRPVVLETSSTTPGATGALSKTPSVRCESWTALERISRSLQRQGAVAVGEAAGLRHISKLDAVCIAPIESDFEFRCFAYLERESKLIDIGGWRTN